MTGVVREVLRLLKNEIDRPAPAAGPEFEQLAAQMKAAPKRPCCKPVSIRKPRPYSRNCFLFCQMIWSSSKSNSSF